jgi:hypothetical protein
MDDGLEGVVGQFLEARPRRVLLGHHVLHDDGAVAIRGLGWKLSVGAVLYSRSCLPRNNPFLGSVSRLRQRDELING